MGCSFWGVKTVFGSSRGIYGGGRHRRFTLRGITGGVELVLGSSGGVAFVDGARVRV